MPLRIRRDSLHLHYECHEHHEHYEHHLFVFFIISETREPVTVNSLSVGCKRQSSPSHLVLCPALGMVCMAASNGIFSAKPRPVLVNTNWSLRMTLQRVVAAFL